ncbi:hypothetical protein EC991_008418 [Linnemannia zychae]|nr:hypothetical protein EC991_008418 [Linnemannia zychae]
MSAPSQPVFFDPILVYGAAFARSVNKLYIIGGLISNDNPTDQFMSLDLTIPWSSTAPAWTKLANGPKQSFFPAAFSVDEQKLFAFRIPDTNSPLQYDVVNDTWSKSTGLFQNANNYELGAVTDPNTGLIYIAGGFHDIDWDASAPVFMDIFDSVTQTVHSELMPEPDNNLANFQSDYISKDEDGTKVIIYGGHLWTGLPAGDLWILDVVNSTWTRGRSGPIRARAACTIAGDQFLLWGGTTELESVPPSKDMKNMLIYNITSSKYVKHYTPPAFYKGLKPPPPLTRTTAPWPIGSDTPGDVAESRPFSIAAVVGGATAGLLLLGALVGVFLIQRRRQRQRLIDEHLEGKIEEESERKAELFGRHQRGGGGEGEHRGGTKNNPQGTDDGDDLEKRLEKLKNRQKEIDETRKLLVLQHQESNPQTVSLQRRAPIALADDNLPEFISSPSTLIQVSSVPVHEDYSPSFLPEDLKDRRTVQATSAWMGMQQGGDSYADDEPRRMERDSTIDEYPSTAGVDSDKPQQRKDPHAVLKSDTIDRVGAEE